MIIGKFLHKILASLNNMCYYNRVHGAGMAQLVAQLIRNQQVEGSSPFPSSSFAILREFT